MLTWRDVERAGELCVQQLLTTLELRDLALASDRSNHDDASVCRHLHAVRVKIRSFEELLVEHEGDAVTGPGERLDHRT